MGGESYGVLRPQHPDARAVLPRFTREPIQYTDSIAACILYNPVCYESPDYNSQYFAAQYKTTAIRLVHVDLSRGTCTCGVAKTNSKLSTTAMFYLHSQTATLVLT